jgi:L-fucose mutarotase
VERPIAYMHVGDTAPGYCSALQREVIADMGASGTGRAEQCEPLERFAFYDRAARAYAIVQTGEMQPWANFLFKKGVISDELRP